MLSCCRVVAKVVANSSATAVYSAGSLRKKLSIRVLGSEAERGLGFSVSPPVTTMWQPAVCRRFLFQVSWMAMHATCWACLSWKISDKAPKSSRHEKTEPVFDRVRHDPMIIDVWSLSWDVMSIHELTRVTWAWLVIFSAPHWKICDWLYWSYLISVPSIWPHVAAM